MASSSLSLMILTAAYFSVTAVAETTLVAFAAFPASHACLMAATWVNPSTSTKFSLARALSSLSFLIWASLASILAT